MTVAQVLPVIALTYVIEERAFLRRAAESNNPERFARIRWVRVAVALVTILTAVWLFLAFLITVLVIAGGRYEEAKVVGPFVIYAVVAGGVVVFVRPAVSIAGAMTGDVTGALRRAMPWSVKHRFARRLRGEIDQWENELRETIRERLSMRVALADRYVRAFQAERNGEDGFDLETTLAQLDGARGYIDAMPELETLIRDRLSTTRQTLEKLNRLSEHDAEDARQYALLMSK
ncbi:hypothetical protein [Microbacterium sp. 179-I 3D3 NHS]|uniref:hypothetical protein n=1 Tax=Microbacterium sp. 179-I 3D3 NHS TaxID=3142382 RepID=UPI0039A32F7D